MSQQVTEALDALRSLGTPAQMRQLAAQGLTPPVRPLVNAHIHLPPNFSGFESVEQAVALAAEQQIGVLGVSNYYDYNVYGDFVHRARAEQIFPLFGLEIITMDASLRDAGMKINDPGNPGKIYLCGKGITRFDQMTDEASRLLGIIRRNDSRRMTAMIDRLEQVFTERGLRTSIDEAYVKQMIVRRHGSPSETVFLQERHLCQAFQERLFELVDADQRIAKLNEILQAETKAADAEDFATMQNDIRAHLMKAGKIAFVEESFVSFEEAGRLILELGGIPSYPTLADGTSPICPFEKSPEILIENIRQRDLHAAELIPIRNRDEVLREYVTAMRAAGLVVTSGTEHNTLDLIPLDPACKGGPVSEDVQEIFWEGACVVAAHQFLTLHGECGYVDSHGKPNPDFPNTDARIAAFASLGAAVIHQYQVQKGVRHRCRNGPKGALHNGA